jgi:hypothetical protein
MLTIPQPRVRARSAGTVRGAGRATEPRAALPGNVSGGRLPPASRAVFEQRLGFDFSRVRLHAGDHAAQAAHAIGAAAFTSGADISFASGAYDPKTRAGRVRLAHELVHVAQQGYARPLAGLGFRRLQCPCDGSLALRPTSSMSRRVGSGSQRHRWTRCACGC